MNEILIIVPIYNKAKFLRKTLDSIGNQTLPADVILLDDGSTDSSKEIEDDYVSNYSYFKKIELEHLGVGRIREYGWNYAITHGYNYVTFVDADDLIDRHFIETLMYPFFVYPNISVSISAMANYHESELLGDGIYTSEEFYCKLRPYTTTVTAKIYRLTEEVKKIHFPPLSTAEDLATNYKIMFTAPYVYFTPKPLYQYIDSGKAASKNLNSTQLYLLKAIIYYLQYNYFKTNKYYKAANVALTSALMFIEEAAKLQPLSTTMLWAAFNLIDTITTNHKDEIDTTYRTFSEDLNLIKTLIGE